MHENIRSFGKFCDDFLSFASEFNRAAGVIVLSETWFSANTCHDIQVTPAFKHIMLTKQEAVSPCLLEIVTHRPILPNFQCVIHIMR